MIRSRAVRAFAILFSVVFATLSGFASAQTTLNEEAKLFMATPAAKAGTSVSISGNTAVVGAPHANSDKGRVDVYLRTAGTSTWTLQKTLTASDGTPGDLFGASVSISGDNLAVGAAGRKNASTSATQAGAVYTFQRSGTTWTQRTTLSLAASAQGDMFGYSVSVQGLTIIVGAPYATTFGHTHSGAAYAFVSVDSGADWHQQASLVVNHNARADDHIGWSVSLSGNTAVVGAPDDDFGHNKTNAGSVYVFSRSGARWRQQARINPNGQAGYRVGASVSISGNTAVFGVDPTNGQAGAAYVYTYTRFFFFFSTWTRQATLTDPANAPGDHFGASAAISGTTIVVGAPAGTSPGGGASGGGAAYVFDVVSGHYALTQYLVPTNNASGDSLGASVALDSGRVLAGAPTRTEGANANNGAAYVFANKKASITTIDSIVPEPSYAGQSYVVHFTVVHDTGGTGTPTGTVDLSDGNGGGCTADNSNAVTLDNTGAGTCTLSSDTAEQITISAQYSGDGTFGGSEATRTHTVNQVPTTTQLALAPNPSVVGQTVTATVSVAANPPMGVTLDPNAAPPTGIITVADGVTGHPTCSVDLSTATAPYKCTLAFGAAGAYSYTASFAADPSVDPNEYGYAPSTSSPATAHTVDPASTATSLSQDISPSKIGQTVTFTSHVMVTAPGSSSPTAPSGTVAVSDGAGDICSITLPATTCQITFGVAGTTHFTATYSGDSNFVGSVSPGLDHFTKAGTTVTITPAPASSVVGQSVTFSVAVTQVGSALGAIPSGTVTLTATGGSPASCTIDLSGGTGSCPITFNAAGSSTVTATYNGDSNFTTSSNQLTYAIAKADSTLTLTQTSTTSAFGQSVTFTATVSAQYTGTPGGSVTFKDGTTTLGAGTLSGGAATFTTSTLALGSHTISGTYGGDTKFNSGSTAAVSHNVVVAGVDLATTTLSQDLATSKVGQQVTFTATVTPTTGITPTPTGTVTVSAGAYTCTANLSAGTGNTATGTCLIAFTTHGTVSATGGYNADLLYSPSSSNGISHTTNPASTTTSFVQDFNPSVVGQKVTFTVTVKPVSPGAGAPTGSVTVSAGGGLSCTAALNLGTNQSGATCALTFAAAGGRTITVTYNNVDGNFVKSNTSAAHTTNANAKADSVTALSASSNPSVTGSTVTLFVTVTPAASGATPTGHVLISDDVDNAITCNITLNASGQGNCPVTFNVIGTSSVHAAYQSDATYNGSSDDVSHDTQAPATFHLQFGTQPTDVLRGERLNGVTVEVHQGASGSGALASSDNSTRVTLSTTACGTSVDFGPVTVVNGVATFTNVGPHFYTPTSSALTLTANSNPAYTTATSNSFNVVANSDLKFADGFDTCRL